ncbi:MAG: hypothetical protein MZV49_11600 [Rhodopseudomonas palustris]|nr:hypothetical protein [Rhodopseudomonas palustris]
MRALLFGLICLFPATSPLLAQGKTPPKAPAIPASETRYFTTLDGLLEGNADIILKEVRQGKTVTAATLDACYPAEKGSERKDRFVVDLAVSGATMSGSTQTQIDKLPVSVKMTRKPTGDTREFKGEVTIGRTTTQLVSTDNSDQSEKEFPGKPFRRRRDRGGAQGFYRGVAGKRPRCGSSSMPRSDSLKSLKGQNLAVSFASLNPNCEALRAGHQVINIAVDPDRAAALVARAKSAPGVVSAGWTSGMARDGGRTIRFAAKQRTAQRRQGQSGRRWRWRSPTCSARL